MRKSVTDCSRAWVLTPGMWKVRERGASTTGAYCWKVLNALLSSFVNLLSFHYKRHNQNKADGTVNKHWDFLTLLVQGWIYEYRTLHVTMVSCLFGFISSGNANCVTGLYQAWRFGDIFFAFNIVVKMIKIIQYKFFRKNIVRRCYNTFEAKYHTFQNILCFFEQRTRVLSETYFTFFSPNVPYKSMCPCTCSTLYNVHVSCYCCATWYGTRTAFFSSLFSLMAKFSWRNPFARGKGLGR